MQFRNADDVIQWTAQWTGERSPDGRPHVSDDLLARIQKVTNEEAWAVLEGQGYKFQFEGSLSRVHPDKILVGRAVTAVMVPKRPDLHDCLLEFGHQTEGRRGFFNTWVIDELGENDVMVVDMFDKVYEGTFSGGNLSSAIAARTKRGQVIFGGIRDLQQIMEIENLQTYYRGVDPTPIRDVTLVGINIPCRIGGAICMPGDIVLGTPSGLTFIPPHLAEECCLTSERTRLRDVFGFERIREGRYSSAAVDAQWDPAMEDDFRKWRQTHTPTDLQHVKWD